MINVAKFIIIIFFKLFYRVSLVGRENVPLKGGAILCSNHVGELDMFVIGYRLKRLVHWMAKQELFKNPILSATIKYFGAFPVKRGKPDMEAIKNAIRLIKEGHIVGIFPEGTRTRKKDVKLIKSSRSPLIIAEKTGAPIIPVAIQTDYKLFGKIKVVFGKPFYVDKENDISDQVTDQTVDKDVNLMRNIYSLLEGK